MREVWILYANVYLRPQVRTISWLGFRAKLCPPFLSVQHCPGSSSNPKGQLKSALDFFKKKISRRFLNTYQLAVCCLLAYASLWFCTASQECGPELGVQSAACCVVQMDYHCSHLSISDSWTGCHSSLNTSCQTPTQRTASPLSPLFFSWLSLLPGTFLG
jgi:hypothetical protein